MRVGARGQEMITGAPLAAPVAASSRDAAASRLVSSDGRLFRIIAPEAVADLEHFLASSPGLSGVNSRRLARHWRPLSIPQEVSALCPRGSAIFEQERVLFPSFPHEWTADMLYDAAQLTLELAVEVGEHGMGLNIATPYNVMFRGSSPVFVNLLAFQTRDPHVPDWPVNAQFHRTFLLPLALYLERGIDPGQALLERPDGLSSEDVYRSIPPYKRILPRYLDMVSIPVWLGSRKQGGDTPKSASVADPEKASYLYTSALRRAFRRLRSLRPPISDRAIWPYSDPNNYGPADQENRKQRFLHDVISSHRALRVLDMSCNAGRYSLTAALCGAAVVMVDGDPSVAGALYRRAAAEKLNILPLVVDLQKATQADFLNRARGSFDCVLMLSALRRSPSGVAARLGDMVELAAELTTDSLVVEYVDPANERYQVPALGSDQNDGSFTRDSFENAFGTRFAIVRKCEIENSRRLVYLLRKRQGLSGSI